MWSAGSHATRWVAWKEERMRPHLWQPPVALSPEETAIVRRIHRAKLFIFLREQRQVLFSPDFQAELATSLYEDKPKGHPPTPPAQLALATILQAYTGVSDDEVLEATTRDRRWQLVLDCLDGVEPPFSTATLVAFRQRLSAHDGDRRLMERTLEVEAGVAPLGGGRVSLTAALDLDGDDPEAGTAGLAGVLAAVEALERWLDTRSAPATPEVQASCLAAQQVRRQDVEPRADGLP